MITAPFDYEAPESLEEAIANAPPGQDTTINDRSLRK